MELAQKGLLAEYRLVFVQPDPENGERVCVGIIVDSDLLYDRDFSRARCLQHDFDSKVASMYLESLRDRVGQSEDIPALIREYAPLFVCSTPRSIARPVTSASKLSLFEHFVKGRFFESYVKHEGKRRARTSVARRERFVTHLLDFAMPKQGSKKMEVIENASASDILGRDDSEIESVALAVRRDEHTILLDGLDLNDSTAKQARQQISRVNHVFWQYKRLAAVDGVSIRRVALVFNGHSHLKPELRDAHDFALDQFKTQSELTLDASSTQAKLTLSTFMNQALLEL